MRRDRRARGVGAAPLLGLPDRYRESSVSDRGCWTSTAVTPEQGWHHLNAHRSSATHPRTLVRGKATGVPARQRREASSITGCPRTVGRDANRFHQTSAVLINTRTRIDRLAYRSTGLLRTSHRAHRSVRQNLPALQRRRPTDTSHAGASLAAVPSPRSSRFSFAMVSRYLSVEFTHWRVSAHHRETEARTAW